MGVAFKRCWQAANCLSNIHNALCNRHLARPLHNVRHFPTIDLWNLLRDDLIAHYNYACDQAPGAWRAGKPLAKLRLIDRSFVFDPVVLNLIKAHIKGEVLLTCPSKARLIQAYWNEVSSYLFADQYRALGKAVYATLASRRDIFGMDVLLQAASGLSHAEIGVLFSEWFQDPGFVIYESDGANWDASMQTCHVLRRVAIYGWLDSDLAGHAKGSLRFRGYAHKTNVDDIWRSAAVTYRGVATVKSGAQDTTTGNIIIRWEQILNALLALPTTPYKVRGMVQGDDVLLLLWFRKPVEPVRLATELIAREALSGIQAKAAVFRDPCCATFLSCTFVPCAAGYTFVPLPGRTFAKLFWTVKQVGRCHLDSYRGQVAEAFLKVYAGWPLMEAFLRAHIREARAGQKPWRMHEVKDFQVSVGCDWFEFLHRRYGLVLDHEAATMQKLADYDPREAVIIDDCFVRHMIQNDLAAVDGRYG